MGFVEVWFSFVVVNACKERKWMGFGKFIDGLVGLQKDRSLGMRMWDKLVDDDEVSWQMGGPHQFKVQTVAATPALLVLSGEMW